MRGPSLLASAIQDAGGNVATMFALAVVPFIGLGAAALDYAGASSTKARMQRVLDAAALMAVQPDGRDDAARTRAAEEFVRKAAADVPDASLKGVQVKVRTVKGVPTAEVTATTDFSTRLISLVGIDDVGVENVAFAKGPEGKHISVQFVIDTSGSMGVASDEDGRKKLTRLTGCAFACHEGESGSAQSGYEVARANGVETRLDATKKAVRIALDEFKTAPNGNTFQVAVTQLDDRVTTLVDYTSNLGTVRTKLDDIRLGYNTQFQRGLPEIAAKLDAQGDGRSADRPEKYVVLVTDGVQSHRWANHASNEFRPIDVELCQRIKDKGVTLAVVNVEYVKIPDHAAYRDTVGRFHHRIKPALRDCASKDPKDASKDFYFEADNPKQLHAEFKRLGERIRTVSTSLTK